MTPACPAEKRHIAYAPKAIAIAPPTRGHLSGTSAASSTPASSGNAYTNDGGPSLTMFIVMNHAQNAPHASRTLRAMFLVIRGQRGRPAGSAPPTESGVVIA